MPIANRLYFILFCCNLQPILGQALSLKVTILDKITKLPLDAISISIPEVQVAQGWTNGYGQFFYDNLSPGPYSIILSSVGYERYEKKIWLSYDLNLKLELNPTSIHLKEIAIHSGPDLNQSQSL